MQGIVSKHFNIIDSLVERRYLALLVSLTLMMLMPFFMVLSTAGPLYLTDLVALLVSQFEHSDLHL